MPCVATIRGSFSAWPSGSGPISHRLSHQLILLKYPKQAPLLPYREEFDVKQPLNAPRWDVCTTVAASAKVFRGTAPCHQPHYALGTTRSPYAPWLCCPCFLLNACVRQSSFRLHPLLLQRLFCETRHQIASLVRTDQCCFFIYAPGSSLSLRALWQYRPCCLLTPA